MGKLLDLFRRTTPAQRQEAGSGWGPGWRAQAPVVSSTWLQQPTFRAADHLVDVVGESHYQEALEAAAGGRTPAGPLRPLVTALLIPEPANPYDPHAVRVDVGGRTVGYLSRIEAQRFAPLLADLQGMRTPATCRAWLTGGWDRGKADRGHFGIRLDLHPELQIRNAAMMPFGCGRVAVTGEEKRQRYLSAVLGSADRREVIAVLKQQNGRLAVYLEDEQVGELTDKMSCRFTPWVSALQVAGSPATAEARVIRGERKVEVFLKLAKPWDRG